MRIKCIYHEASRQCGDICADGLEIVSKKLISKFKNSITCVDKNTFKWRTYYGLYSPDKINPSKAEIYASLSKDKYVSQSLQIDETSIKLADIYKTISYIIGEEVY